MFGKLIKNRPVADIKLNLNLPFAGSPNFSLFKFGLVFLVCGREARKVKREHYWNFVFRRPTIGAFIGGPARIREATIFSDFCLFEFLLAFFAANCTNYFSATTNAHYISSTNLLFLV